MISYNLDNYEFDLNAFLPMAIFDRITDARVRRPQLILQEAGRRKRRPDLAPDGRLVLLAADHPARMLTAAGENPIAMGDRYQYLGRILRIMASPGIDGLIATTDIVEDLLILGALVREGGGPAFLDNRVLIGSMNPEEGRLRPQIFDRFGLRLVVHGLTQPADRLEAYRRTRVHLTNPRAAVAAYAEETRAARADIQAARQILPQVELTPQAEQAGLGLVRRMQIDSLRAEITLFEAARAYAAADNRLQATPADVRAVAPLAVRLRRSAFMVDYFKAQQAEEKEIRGLLDDIVSNP